MSARWCGGEPGQGEVPGHDDLLRLPGLAGEAEDRGVLPLVHLAALGEPGVLAVLGDRHLAEGQGVGEGVAQELGVGHDPAVVAEDAHPGLHHLPELRELLPGQAAGDRPDGEHVAEPGGRGEVEDLPDHRGVVGHRVGVRHRRHRGVPAEGRRPAAGLHGLGVLAARLAQVRVGVHEARRDHEPRAVELEGPPRHRVRGHHDPVGDPDVGDLVPAGGRVHDAAAPQQDGLRHRVPPPRPCPRGAGTAGPCGSRSRSSPAPP